MAAWNFKYAPLNSPLFTGDPRGPTPPPGDDDNSLATTEFVQDAVIGGPTPTLAQVLGAGNSTGGTDLELTGGDEIVGATGSTLTMRGVGAGGNVLIESASGDVTITAAGNIVEDGGDHFTSANSIIRRAVSSSIQDEATTTYALTAAAATRAVTTTIVDTAPTSHTLTTPAVVLSTAGATLRGTDGGTPTGFSVRPGDAVGGNVAGVDFSARAGAATGTGAGSSVILSPGPVVTGARGRIHITHDGPDTDRVVELSTTGANGAAARMFAGTRNPEGLVTGNPGDLYLRNDGASGGLIFVKISGVGTTTGWSGQTAVFNSSGLISAPRRWIGTATTDASGDFTADISAAGFSAAPTVTLAAQLNTTTVTDMVWPTIRTLTATTIDGTAIRGIVLALLGATLRRAAAGVTIHIVAEGT